MKITVLVDNKTENPYCEAEWGLSLLIESKQKKMIFDTGASDMFLRNAKALGIELDEIDTVVLSHGHYDHTEGVPALSKINKKCRVYIRENAFRNYFEKESDIGYEHVGIRWTPQFLDTIKERLVYTNARDRIGDEIELISNIPWDKKSVDSENSFYWLSDDGKYHCDDMSHEQILIIHESQKMVVCSGCSHSGVLSILEYVKELYPDKAIEAFVAGMHLYNQSTSSINNLLDEMEKYGIHYYVPLHCSGMKAIMEMKKRFGERCIIAASGDEILL